MDSIYWIAWHRACEWKWLCSSVLKEHEVWKRKKNTRTRNSRIPSFVLGGCVIGVMDTEVTWGDQQNTAILKRVIIEPDGQSLKHKAFIVLWRCRASRLCLLLGNNCWNITVEIIAKHRLSQHVSLCFCFVLVHLVTSEHSRNASVTQFVGKQAGSKEPPPPHWTQCVYFFLIQLVSKQQELMLPLTLHCCWS